MFALGEPAWVALWSCNDSAQTPACELCYQLELAGQFVRTGRVDAQMPNVTGGSRFQGYLSLEVRAVSQPTPLCLRVSLVAKSAGRTRDHYVFNGPCATKMSRNVRV